MTMVGRMLLKIIVVALPMLALVTVMAYSQNDSTTLLDDNDASAPSFANQQRDNRIRNTTTLLEQRQDEIVEFQQHTSSLQQSDASDAPRPTRRERRLEATATRDNNDASQQLDAHENAAEEEAFPTTSSSDTMDDRIPTQRKTDVQQPTGDKAMAAPPQLLSVTAASALVLLGVLALWRRPRSRRQTTNRGNSSNEMADNDDNDEYDEEEATTQRIPLLSLSSDHRTTTTNGDTTTGATITTKNNSSSPPPQTALEQALGQMEMEYDDEEEDDYEEIAL